MKPTSGQGGAAPGQLALRITFLQMMAHPARTPYALPADLRIERAVAPSVPFYRFLYNTVGEDWLWTERRRWTDEAIATTVQHSAVDIWVLYVAGQPAGYAELDRRVESQVELAYFGLMPNVLGRGLGPHLLRFAIDMAWASDPTRVWVHTCSHDHPAALSVYERAGFVVYKTEDRYVEDPRSVGLIRRDAAPHLPLKPFSSII